MKSATIVLMLTGLVTVLAGFGYGIAFVNLPFQDPTPGQAWQQRHDDLVSQTIVFVGIAQFVLGSFVGVFALVVAGLRGRKATAAI